MGELQFILPPASLADGSDFEKAAFGLLEISAGSRPLTSGFRIDEDGRVYERGPYASGYHLAEWLAWNWWRLRWEPRPNQREAPLEWRLAHELTGIGGGYVWPNITIASDGFHCVLDSVRSIDPSPRPFDYIGAVDGKPAVVTAADFEQGVDSFISLVLQRLADAGLKDSDLHKHWNDLNTERSDPEFARFRRFEALLGFDPDEVDDLFVVSRLDDAVQLGESALDELAIGVGGGGMFADQIKELTQATAFDISADGAVRLDGALDARWGASAAWRIGVATADALRTQLGLGSKPLGDQKLADFAGISSAVLGSDQHTGTLSWVFRPEPHLGKVAIRSPHPTGRRFDVARLVGDRLFSENGFTVGEPLSPATRSYSYRQKAQRAFAAELLSPWQSVQDMLGDDDSDENVEQVAGHFGVSDWTVRTQIINHTGVGREYLR